MATQSRFKKSYLFSDDDLDPSADEITQVPEGSWPMTVTDASMGVSKAGSVMLTIELKLDESHWPINYYQVLPGSTASGAMRYFRLTIAALELSKEDVTALYAPSQLTPDTKKQKLIRQARLTSLLGRKVIAVVEHNEVAVATNVLDSIFDSPDDEYADQPGVTYRTYANVSAIAAA